ncbi:cutinase family protein [Nocardia sp. NPDC051570]|uniref:cutinase family protein n=1 Tax=Nocardia sp. NPDC051570 TaxID=3364324 RepID=UPI0037A4BBE0
MNRRRAAATTTVITAGIVVALLAVSSSGAAPIPLAHTDAPGCAPVTVVALAGTTETSPAANPDVAAGTFAAVTDPLKQRLGNRVRIRYPGYPASAFDKGLTYAESRKRGVQAATDEIAADVRSCPSTKFILGGFSQGAHAIMDLAVDIGHGRGPIPADKVLAVGTLSDPGQGTPGEALVGPPVQGVGIAGPRQEGVGALAGRVATICRNQPVDLYCATNRAKDGFLAGLGNVLGNSTGDGGDPGSKIGSSLVSDFTGADLGTIPSSVSTLTTQLANPNGQFNPQDVTSAASNIVTSLRPVADLVQSLAGNTAASQMLSSAPTGSPQALAGQALDTLSHIDLTGAVNTAARILTTAQNALATQGANPSASPTASAGDLTQSANQLAQQMQPLTTMQPDALSTATGIMSTLRPATVVNQLLNAATGVTSFAANLPKILDDLFVQLPQKIIALDVQGAHQICGDLNNLFQPLVKMAAGVDLGWVGQIVGMIPDPQGFAQIASVILGILGHVDVIRLANDVGALQEVGWNALQALTSGRPIDAGLALTGLIAPGLDVASVAFGAVTGNAQKTDPAYLGQLNPAAHQSAGAPTAQPGPADLPGLAKTLTDAANSQGAQDLQQMVSQGLDAAAFYGTNAHNLYNDFIVDPAGRTAPRWMSDWFAQQAAKAAL